MSDSQFRVVISGRLSRAAAVFSLLAAVGVMAAPARAQVTQADAQVAAAGRALGGYLDLTTLGSYYDRTGGEVCLGVAGEDGRCETTFWLGVVGETGSFDNSRLLTGRGPSYDFSLGGVRLGMDLYRSAHEVMGLYAGAGVAKGKLDGRSADGIGLTSGKADIHNYLAAGYWTHRGGFWFSDLVAQGSRVNSDVSTVSTTSSAGSETGTKGYNLLGSLELGAPIPLGCGRFSFEPQLQVVYQRLHPEDAGDASGSFTLPVTNTVYGRFGGRISERWPLPTDGEADFVIWARANVWHMFTDSPVNTVVMAGDPAVEFVVSPTLGRTWSQVGVGASGEITGSIGLFSTLDYNANFGPGTGRSLDGRLGIRVNW
ncbi:MAG: autotransporter outer membrane beta-barrel domain-containing protein [Gemmatimonadota bacterium]|jgi:outer membrane autotransporter protein|nr:autotransporter outer membrane beta-barrel domain-containing protein [Gemmatimonadota bacterium]